ncbi:MAG: hypothetical protein DRP87_07665 [Spirochaetes bacterium]|nr:MAG: hypothetical protein DRP87_07665 [Spirochaetota bacterium]
MKSPRIKILNLSLILFFLITTILSLSGCKQNAMGEMYSEDSISISWTIPASSRAVSDAVIQEADKVIAVPVYEPFIVSPSMIANAKTAEIDETGGFVLTFEDTERENRRVLMLIDSTKPKHEQILAFVGLGDSEDNLILFPVDSATEDIDAGELEQENDEAVSEQSLEENSLSFEMNLSNLREIAKLDNMLKVIKNLYINYDNTNGTLYENLFSYTWGVEPEQVKNQFSSPANYTYDEYSIQISTSNPDITFDGVYNHDYIIEIVPPEPVVYVDNNSHTLFTSDCGTWENFEEREDGRYANTNETHFALYEEISRNRVAFGTSGLHFINYPQGYWLLKKDSETLAYFDLAISKPFKPGTEIPVVYLPSLKIDVDAENYVTAFNITWYQYNFSNEQYEELTDLSMFKKNCRTCGNLL